jgi:phage-related minor tail protein
MTPPDAELARALNRLGPEGSRAYDFLLAASEQLSADGTRAGELASYSLREALIALVSLGGQHLQGVGETAREVVRRWSLAKDGRLARDAVGQAIAELKAALEGPGPNERRLESAVARIA